VVFIGAGDVETRRRRDEHLRQLGIKLAPAELKETGK